MESGRYLGKSIQANITACLDKNPSSQQKTHSHACHGLPHKNLSMVGHISRCP